MDASDLENLIAACYRAAVDGSEWPATLDLIGHQFHASGAGIVFYDEARTAHTVHSMSLRDAHKPYRDYWWRHDTRIALAKKIKFKNGDVATDFHLIRQEEKRRDPFFQEFGRTHGFDELMGYFAEDPHGGTMTVSVPRSTRGGPFDASELAALKVIGGHVARAFALTATLQVFRSHISDLERCLLQTGTGVIVLGANNRVEEMNDTARHLANGCIDMTRDRILVATNPGERRKLESIVDTTRLPSSGEPRSAVIRSVDGDFRLLVETARIDAENHIVAAPGARHAHTLVLLRDFSAGSRSSISPHLEQMGLTPAEARVAMLIGRGLSPLEAARKLRVSPHTIRVQLRSIYSKLCINRQSELAGIVTRLDVLLQR